MTKNLENSWFISDLHFGHEWTNKQGINRGVCLFERTQFKTIQEHDHYIISTLCNWGYKYQDQTLYILGDFGDINTLRQLTVYLRYACGITVIGVKGNHDAADKESDFAKVFDEYWTIPQYIHPRLIVSHEPVWPAPAGTINIHGHLHAAKLDSDNHINASIHVAHYTPIGWKTIQKAFAKVEKPSYKFLQEPWRNNYIFTQYKDDAVYDKKTGRINLKESIKLYNKKYNKHIQ